MPLASETGQGFVDAQNVPGITIDAVIPEVCKSLRSSDAMSSDEVQMRRSIATTVLITMGGDILHFEKDIDTSTGIVDVDWKFSSSPTTATTTQQQQQTGLSFMGSGNSNKQQQDSTRIKSHAVMRVYASHTDPKSGMKFSHLLGCEAIDLAALIQHSIHVNSGRINPKDEHQYDFALRTNFCNTFVVCTVLPMPSQQTNVQYMQKQLQMLQSSLDAYRQEEISAKKQGRSANHENHDFMPSILAHLPDIETMVKLQQGLQQVYCVEGINKADAVLTEANGIAYAQVVYSPSPCFLF